MRYALWGSKAYPVAMANSLHISSAPVAAAKCRCASQPAPGHLRAVKTR